MDAPFFGLTRKRFSIAPDALSAALLRGRELRVEGPF
jgi:hypothetical protein